MRKFQQVHIILMIALLIGFFISFYFGITSFKEMMAAKKDDLRYPSTIPVLVFQKNPYTSKEYQNLINLLNPTVNFVGINAEVKNDQIYITAQSIEAEEDALHFMLSLLSIDKNLQVVSICGKPGNGCNNNTNTIEFVVKAEKTNANVSLTPL